MFQNNAKVKDFEFYYLTELTRRKIKPLSRWEHSLPERAHQWLRYHGLYTQTILRKTRSGKTVIETIFSTSQRYTDLYRQKFHNTYVNKSSGCQELEGFLFGYPSCCVKQFVRHPYSPNGLEKDVQSILFHWACDTCRSTPGLIPYYQSAHKAAFEWYHHEFPNKMRAQIYRRTFNKVMAPLLLSGGLLSAQAPVDSTHYIPLKEDINQNGLSYAEEIYLGTYDHGGSFSDCQTYAILFKTIIDSLPDTLQTDRVYKIEHMMRGVVQCPKCGINVNMGYVTVVNPLRNLELDIPYLGLHFMENGFFSYGNEDEYQRVSIDTLKKIIYPFNLPHCLAVTGDSDGDYLTDAEEDSLWIDYTADKPDFNGNGVQDGVEITEELIRLFPKLKEEADGIHSHVEFKPVYGLENCQICGSTHNMGAIEITNPENKRTCQIPYIGLHAMAHGSFAFNGAVHENQRINAVKLYRAMKTHMLFIPNDSDSDGLNDEEEIYFGFDPNKADSNGDGMCDGMELAVTLAAAIQSLPTVPILTEPYAQYLDMDGIQLCAVCGDEIPMGVIQIYNPLINTISPLEISYYSFHFLQKGSFACEGADDRRINPVRLSEFLNHPTGVDPDPAASLPITFDLQQNCPNPFNPTTVIHYQLKANSFISLIIFDMAGREIATLVEESKKAGDYTATFDASGFASGIYFARMVATGTNQKIVSKKAQKMLLVK